MNKKYRNNTGLEMVLQQKFTIIQIILRNVLKFTVNFKRTYCIFCVKESYQHKILHVLNYLNQIFFTCPKHRCRFPFVSFRCCYATTLNRTDPLYRSTQKWSATMATIPFPISSISTQVCIIQHDMHRLLYKHRSVAERRVYCPSLF